jgi:PKHD-type hydroxylase
MNFYSEPNFFSKEELEQINNIISDGEWLTAVAGQQLERKTKIKWIHENHSFLFDRIVLGFQEANKYYDFNITGVKEISILKYDTGDFYSKHIDMSGHDSERKLSVVVPLSNDYEGGDTLFYTSKNSLNMPKEVNIATFFPSYIVHEVTEVTKGVRYSLVAWANGEYFK